MSHPNLMPRRNGVASVIPDDRPPDEFQLSGADKASSTWQRLRAEMQKRLDAKRAENDGPYDDAETAKIRGHIECLKALIALGDDPPTFEE